MRKGKEKGCCKNRLLISFLASLIILIALALNANASIDCNASIPSTINVGTQLNATFNTSDVTTWTNIYGAFEAKSSLTANSSFSLIGNVSNTSNRNHINLTVGDLGIFIIEDANNYVFRVTCNAQGGGENVTTSSEATGKTIDRGNIPSTPTTPNPSGKQTSKSQTIWAAVNGANTTSCRLTFVGSNPGQKEYTMTHTGNNCSQAFSSLASTTFRYTISASDETNRSSETSETEFYIQSAGTSGAKKYIAATSGRGFSQTSSTAQQKAMERQAESALDKAIAKAPVNAQAGLAKAKEAVTNQYKGKEAIKTWVSTGLGCTAGFMGLTLGPVGLITIPAGCLGGHLIGMVV